MKRLVTVISLLVFAGAALAASADEFQTSAGPLKVTPVTHGSLMIEAGGQVIHVDPWGKGHYGEMPKADIILLTHTHGDHLDAGAIAVLRKPGTAFIAPPAVAETVTEAKVLRNGESAELGAWRFDAVPMYNIEHMRSPGNPYHPKGVGNGYVVTYGGLRVYIAGDTEGIPEMRALKNIDVAFIPMNLPYTMSPGEAADAIKAFQPKVVYPYHYRGSDLSVLEKELAGTGIEVRLRDWY